jgi:hypothetical protein
MRDQVVDGGDVFEPPSERPAGGEPGGWGLWIVDELAERWGLAQGSTRVWFGMPAPARARTLIAL